jgi:hypothetical protein
MGIMYASALEWLRPRVWNTDFGQWVDGVSISASMRLFLAQSLSLTFDVLLDDVVVPLFVFVRT